MGKEIIVWASRVITLVILVLVISCSPNGSTVSVEADASVKANEDVQVSIRAANIKDLTAVEVHLLFDPAFLEVTRLIDGDLIKADFVVQNTFDNSAGTIDYAVAQINRAPSSGTGVLFGIIFHARVPGKSPIRFRETLAAPDGVLLADSNGMAIQVTLRESDVSVSGVSGGRLPDIFPIFSFLNLELKPLKE